MHVNQCNLYFFAQLNLDRMKFRSKRKFDIRHNNLYAYGMNIERNMWVRQRKFLKIRIESQCHFRQCHLRWWHSVYPQPIHDILRFLSLAISQSLLKDRNAPIWRSGNRGVNNLGLKPCFTLQFNFWPKSDYPLNFSHKNCQNLSSRWFT